MPYRIAEEERCRLQEGARIKLKERECIVTEEDEIKKKLSSVPEESQVVFVSSSTSIILYMHEPLLLLRLQQDVLVGN